MSLQVDMVLFLRHSNQAAIQPSLCCIQPNLTLSLLIRKWLRDYGDGLLWKDFRVNITCNGNSRDGALVHHSLINSSIKGGGIRKASYHLVSPKACIADGKIVLLPTIHTKISWLVRPGHSLGVQLLITRMTYAFNRPLLICALQ